MRKLFSWILVLAMVLSLAPMGVFAAEPETVAEIAAQPEIKPETPAEDGTYEIPFQVNPLYEETYEQGVLPMPEPEESDPEDEPLQNAPPVLYAYYETPERAAAQLRKGMTQRQPTVEIYVKSEDSNYTKLGNAVMAMALEHTGNPKEGDYLLWQYAGWGAQVSQKYENGMYYFHYTIRLAYYTTAEQETELSTATYNLRRMLNVGHKSDYEKVKAVYDYVCQNITYDYANLNDQSYMLKHTAYAALVNKTAVCQGYATLIYRLLLELGVDNRVIAGESPGGPHGWNIVKLGNVYYNLDSTWDAGTSPYQYFLKSTLNFGPHYRYLDYETTQFHTQYPISETDYVDGVAGVPDSYYVYGICGDDAYFAVGRDGSLVIFGTGATYNCSPNQNSNDAPPWRFWKESITSVIIDEGITALGWHSFPYYSITLVYLPDSLVSVGNHAFACCESLEYIRWGASLETIGDSAFFRCKALTSVHLPDTVKTIEGSAFQECKNLREITLGNSLEVIKINAFRYCESLEEIRLPETLTTIGVQAFSGCTSLQEITIPASVTAATGFDYCANLERAYIYSDTVGENAFSNCRKLHTVVMSDEITRIEAGAFDNCPALTGVVLPSAVTYLGRTALQLTAIDTITIPAGVTELGEFLFFGCKALKEIRFSGDAPKFNPNVFSQVTAIAYYPMNNPTWTEAVMQNYGGSITWLPDCPDHHYEAVTYTTTCVRDGGTVYTCPTCNHSYTENLQYATGLHIFAHDLDTTCETCGYVRPIRESRPVVHMFRMYDPNSGEHFYTGSEEERDNLVAAGWNYEGVGFTFPLTTGDPVFRLYHPYTGEHLYTMDMAEMDYLVSRGWNYEGIAFNSAFADEVPQYRLHNPNAIRGAYHFTSSVEERDFLIAAGWEYQGIGWYSCWK